MKLFKLEDAPTGSRKESYAVTITSTASSHVTQFRVSRVMVVVAGIAIGLLFLALVTAGLLLGYLLREAGAAHQLRSENLYMRRELARVVAFEDRVAQLDSTRRAVLKVVGVEEPPLDPVLESRAEQTREAPSGEYQGVQPGGAVSAADLREMTSTLVQMPLSGPQTREFGPLPDTGLFHLGVDIAGETGAPVVAPGDGLVTFIGSDEILGKVLVISHGPRIQTMYGHASKILVGLGDYIITGQTIAEVGNTGRSSAPHLHFETHCRNLAIDPALVFSTLRPGTSPLSQTSPSTTEEGYEEGAPSDADEPEDMQ